MFLAAVVGLPWLGLRWWHRATRPQQAMVSCKTGSCALSVDGAVPVAQRMEDGQADVPEGTTYTTDGRSKGFIRLFDGSTVNLEANTAVTLEYMRRPRFSAATVPSQSVLYVQTPDPGEVARLTIGTTWAPGQLVLATEQGEVQVAPESRVRLELRTYGLKAVVTEGRAEVRGADRSVSATADQVVESTADGGPQAPRTALENVLADSDFATGLEESSWQERVDLLGGTNGVTRPTATVAALGDGRTTAVQILREGSDSRPADLILAQDLAERDVSWASKLGVRARLRINQQSLPLGGTRGSEFPVILNLVGRTSSGEQRDWKVGFFAVRPAEGEPPGKYVAKATDVEVPLGEWYTFESGNLLDPESARGFSRFDWPSAPVQLDRFEIISSGHDYAADVDLVEVWVK